MFRPKSEGIPLRVSPYGASRYPSDDTTQGASSYPIATTRQEPSSPVELKQYMTEPQPLLTVDSNGKLQLNEDTMRTIENCTQPVVCVGVIGPARTGKSLLMNRLLGRQSGFDLGSTLDSKTKGIWAWLVPHPKDANLSLLLLDTEGLAHAADGCCDRDNCIFVLTVLISGCLLYNCQGVFDAEKVDKLELIANLSQHMVEKMGSGRDTDVLQLFPALYIVVRDFTLELVMDGERCSPDEYLERCLKTKFGHNKETRTRNATKDAVKSYFPNRACFVLPRPTEEEKLSALEELGEEDLKPNFVKGVNDICDRIHKEVKPKSIQGKVFIGRVLGTLIRDCLKAFESGYIPTALSTLEALSKTECSKGIEAALEMYRLSMNVLKEDFPVTERQLDKHHDQTFKTIVKPEFDKYVVFDDKADGFRKLKEAIDKDYKFLQKINEEDSRTLCQRIIKTLHEAYVLTNLEENPYTDEDGLERFDKDVEKVISLFGRCPHKGPPKIIMAALEEYKSEIGDLRTTIEVNATEITRKNQEIDEQRQRVDQQREQRKILERNFEEFKTQVRRKDERYCRQFKELKTENGALRVKHEKEISRIIREAKSQAMEMQRTNQHLQHDLEMLKERNQYQNQTARYLTERAEMLQRQNLRLEDQLERIQENESDERCIIL